MKKECIEKVCVTRTSQNNISVLSQDVSKEQTKTSVSEKAAVEVVTASEEAAVELVTEAVNRAMELLTTGVQGEAEEETGGHEDVKITECLSEGSEETQDKAADLPSRPQRAGDRRLGGQVQEGAGDRSRRSGGQVREEARSRRPGRQVLDRSGDRRSGGQVLQPPPGLAAWLAEGRQQPGGRSAVRVAAGGVGREQLASWMA